MIRSAAVPAAAFAAALAATLAAAPAAQATPVHMLEPFFGAPSVAVTPFETAGSAAAFHGFDGQVSTPGFALARNTAHWYLHRSTGTGALSLGLVLAPVTGRATGQFGFLLAGAPASAVQVVEDDWADTYGWDADGTAVGAYRFSWGASFTDGFVMGGLDGGPWSMTAAIDEALGVTAGVFVSAAPEGGWTTVALASGVQQGFTLSRLLPDALPGERAAAAEVPLPGAAGLLAAGLGAVAAVRRRRRRAAVAG